MESFLGARSIQCADRLRVYRDGDVQGVGPLPVRTSVG